MKNLTTITISFLAMILAGCNFYTDVDADWNAEEGAESSECDELFVLLEAEDNEQRRAELAAEYARCAGDDTNPDEDGHDDDDCVDEDGSVCENPDDPCSGPDCNTLPFDIDCQQIQSWVANMSPEEALMVCMDYGFTERQCRRAAVQCLGEDWENGNPDDPGSGSAICVMAYDALADVGIDPDSLTSDDAYELCVNGAVGQSEYGQVDESICQQIADDCFSSGDNSGGPDTCDSLIQQASNLGVSEPTTQEEANAIHAQCLQVSNDAQLCDELITCYGFMP